MKKPKRQWVVEFKAGTEWQFLPNTFETQKRVRWALAVWKNAFPLDKFRLRSLPILKVI